LPFPWRLAERAGCERADGLLADRDRDGQIRQEADATTVFLFLRCLAGEIVDRGEADCLPANELRLVPGHDTVGNLREELNAGTRPRGEGCEDLPVGGELEERAAVSAEGLDDEAKTPFDLFADSF